jgi:hypothetical protein
MYITEPTSFEITITQKENNVIGECLAVLTNIIEEVEKRDCTILQDSIIGEAICVGDIKDTQDILRILMEVNMMY